MSSSERKGKAKASGQGRFGPLSVDAMCTSHYYYCGVFYWPVSLLVPWEGNRAIQRQQVDRLKKEFTLTGRPRFIGNEMYTTLPTLPEDMLGKEYEPSSPRSEILTVHNGNHRLLAAREWYDQHEIVESKRVWRVHVFVADRLSKDELNILHANNALTVNTLPDDWDTMFDRLEEVLVRSKVTKCTSREKLKAAMPDKVEVASINTIRTFRLSYRDIWNLLMKQVVNWFLDKSSFSITTFKVMLRCFGTPEWPELYIVLEAILIESDEVKSYSMAKALWIAISAFAKEIGVFRRKYTEKYKPGKWPSAEMATLKSRLARVAGHLAGLKVHFNYKKGRVVIDDDYANLEHQLDATEVEVVIKHSLPSDDSEWDKYMENPTVYGKSTPQKRRSIAKKVGTEKLPVKESRAFKSKAIVEEEEEEEGSFYRRGAEYFDLEATVEPVAGETSEAAIKRQSEMAESPELPVELRDSADTDETRMLIREYLAKTSLLPRRGLIVNSSVWDVAWDLVKLIRMYPESDDVMVVADLPYFILDTNWDNLAYASPPGVKTEKAFVQMFMKLVLDLMSGRSGQVLVWCSMKQSVYICNAAQEIQKRGIGLAEFQTCFAHKSEFNF